MVSSRGTRKALPSTLGFFDNFSRICARYNDLRGRLGGSALVEAVMKGATGVADALLGSVCALCALRLLFSQNTTNSISRERKGMKRSAMDARRLGSLYSNHTFEDVCWFALLAFARWFLRDGGRRSWPTDCAQLGAKRKERERPKRKERERRRQGNSQEGLRTLAAHCVAEA